MHSVEDIAQGELTKFTYDAFGKLIQTTSSKNGYNSYGTNFSYDSNGRLYSVWNRISYSDGTSNAAFGNQYFYNTEGRLAEEYIRIVGNSNERKTYTYDNFNRLSGTSLDIGSVLINSSYTFTQVGTNLSGQIASNSVSVNGASTGYTYSYDAKGNITKIAYSSGKEIRYVYDNLNQLIREDNSILNCTYIYTYDNAGNITSTKKYALTAAASTPTGTYTEEAYTYTNNILVSYKGVAISYDSLGNPTSYYNGTSYSFTWQGKQLTGATKSGISYSFTYNDNGIRTSKTKSGVKTTYYLSGSTLIGEETNGNLTLYIYDANGSPIGFQYHGANYATGVFDTYVYEKNLQGDIVAVYSSAGTKLVSYAYDAYGSCTVTYYNNGASTQAASNPFRYRGYYYDSDLGLYYLNSRYYDANTRRFISADNISVITATPMSLTDKNLYAYCDNNPVMRVDGDGEFWVTIGIMAVGALIGMAISAVSSAVTQQAINGTVNWKSVGVAAASGFVSGAVAASPLGLGGQIIAGGIIGGVSYVADSAVNKTEMTLDGALISVGMGAASGLIGGKGANHKMSLTNTINNTKRTIAREMRRANQKYAQKAIAKMAFSRNNILELSVFSASARFAFGTGVSNAFNTWYSNNIS